MLFSPIQASDIFGLNVVFVYEVLFLKCIEIGPESFLERLFVLFLHNWKNLLIRETILKMGSASHTVE